jgi:hypothetical protein
VKLFRTCEAVLLTAGIATFAHGQPPAAPAPVARTVFIQTMDTEFSKMDADKNGILTKKEIEDYQRALTMFVAQSRNVALFQALDKDKNGTLTPAEFAALPMNVPPANAAPVFAQADLNHDNQVTRVEYRAGKLTNFDRMDTDKDGIVTAAEMRAAGLIK